MSIERREILKAALAAAAGGVVTNYARTSAASDDSGTGRRPWPVTDVNVSLFQWPFRRLAGDSPEALVEKLRSLDIRHVWAGSFEGVLHRDLAGVNTRLAEACRAAPSGLLVPIGSVNPALPDWNEDLRRCDEVHRMPGVRLHPNYHGYGLDDPCFAEFLSAAAERRLLVQIAVSLEDVRTQSDRVRMADVDLGPLPAVLAKVPGARVMLLNHKLRSPAYQALAAAAVTFDTARIEATDGIERLMELVTPERVVLGSHAPFFIHESALIKVYESNLDERQLRLLLSENAARLAAS